MIDNNFTALDRLTEALASEFALVNTTALAHRQGRRIPAESTLAACNELMCAAQAAVNDMTDNADAHEWRQWSERVESAFSVAYALVRKYINASQKEDENMNTECAPLRDDDHHCCQGRAHGAHHDADCPRRQRVNFADRLSKLCAYVARLERMAANGERVDMDQAVAKIDQLNAAATAELANAVNPTRAQMTTASLRMALIGYVDELAKATTPAIPKAVDNVTGADADAKRVVAKAVEQAMHELQCSPFGRSVAGGERELTEALAYVAAEALKAGLDQGK